MNFDDLDEKILITGHGRSGTSFLLYLFHLMGFKTDLKEETQNVELHLPDGQPEEPEVWNRRPKILKSPFSSTLLADAIWEGWWQYYQSALEHVIIPMRAPSAVVESHERRAWPLLGIPKWLEKSAPSKKDHLKWHTGNLIGALTYAHIPFTILNFPLLVEDATYLHNSLRAAGLIGRMSFQKFVAFWEEANCYEKAKGKQKPDYSQRHW